MKMSKNISERASVEAYSCSCSGCYSEGVCICGFLGFGSSNTSDSVANNSYNQIYNDNANVSNYTK
jgi:putative bacteriocin precursor